MGGSSGTLPRTAIKKAAKSGELPPQPAKPQQQQQAPAPAPAALAVPQVAICPATPAVNEQELIIVSSQKQTSSSTVMSSSSSSTTVQQQGGVNSVDLEEQKRLEYEKWFKTQEKEQQELEYDCSVKYEATTTNTQQAEIVQTSSVKEVATHTQSVQNNDEADRAKKAAEEQQRLEQEKRELIRTQGDLQYTQSSVQQQQMEQVQLRSTGGAKDIKDNIRQSGVFVGVMGDLNALVADGNEKHSVQDIVKHFSKIKPGDMPQQMMPQHYLVQQPPSLSELQEQAKERQFSYQKKDQVDASSTLSHAEQQAAEEKAKLFERRTSLKEYLLMDGEKSQQGNQIIDPSTILQVDGSVEGRKLYQNGARRTASGRELDSQGRLIETDKWDNHNAIARGWKTVEDNYHPVTFRKIYGVEKQAPTPVPMMRQATPNQPSTPAPAPKQVIPAEEQEAVSDL